MKNVKGQSLSGHTEARQLRQELLSQADTAQAAGDNERCIDLIRKIFETFERQVGRLGGVTLALTSLSSLWIGDFGAALITSSSVGAVHFVQL